MKADDAAVASLPLSLHQITSLGTDFRTAMTGYARAGITLVEPHLEKVRDYENAAGSGSARQLLDDLGLRVVSSSNQLFLDEAGPQRDQALEDLRWKLDLMAAIGADRLVCPSVASQTHVRDDYDGLIERYHEAAELARPYGACLMLEFTRTSRLVSNLRTALMVVRRLGHPNFRLMLDTYHFWAGSSKFEDLALLEPGEIHHVHIADMPADPPIEVATQPDRAWPGEGIAPLAAIVFRLRDKGYQGPLSLELFDPAVQNAEPEVVAHKAQETLSALFSTQTL